MEHAGKIFRVFVSSTFSDLKEERNALQERVFPDLQEFCAQRGCRFQAVDLRWGVSQEAGLDQQTMAICLEEIKRCQKTTRRPNFIILLGDRYGSRPLPAEIPADEFDGILHSLPANKEGVRRRILLDQWYWRDDNATPSLYCLQPQEKDFQQWEAVEDDLHSILLEAIEKMSLQPEQRMKYFASATEQEITEGVFRVPDAREHVYCFFRKIKTEKNLSITKDLPPDRSVKDFVDLNEDGSLDQEAQTLLQDLKKRLFISLPNHIYKYEAKWIGSGVTTEHIESLCTDVYTSLSDLIAKQIEQSEEVEALDIDTEIAAHDDFSQERADPKFFTGRKEILKTISDHLLSTDRHPLVIFGESGVGKSTLVARAVERTKRDHPDAMVIVRFIGVTPGSSDGRTLLESLCRQVTRYYGADESTIPIDYQTLVQEFTKRLAFATVDKPLILFLDALDQLSNVDYARNLAWLPAELPRHVRLIVTTLPDDCLTTLQNKLIGVKVHELESMKPEEGSELLNRWLTDAGRGLQWKQRQEILANFEQCPLPLYLKLAFEQARHWHSYDGVPNLGSDIPSIIANLFTNLSKGANHGNVLVSRSVAYLVAAKKGLTEEELLGILSKEQDKAVMKDFRERSPRSPEVKKLPMIIWARLRFDLQSYLTERNEDGISLMTFFHRQMGVVARQMYLLEAVRVFIHNQLAQYFKGRLEHPIQRNAHTLVEVPYQLMRSEHEEEAMALLCELPYLDDRCQWCNTYELLQDFEAVHHNPRADFVQYHEFLRKHVQRLKRYPTLLFTLVQNEGFPTAKLQAQALIAMRQWHKPWLQTIPAWMPSPSQSRGSTETPDVLAQVEFDASPAIELAQDAHIAFYLRRIGEIGMIDLTKGRELANIVSTRRFRPLALISSPGAEFLAVAFENGEADLLHLYSSETGYRIEPLKTFTYLRPEFEAPVMALIDKGLWYQDKPGRLGRLQIMDCTASQSFVALPPVTGDGELSGVTMIDEQVVITMRQQNNTTIITLAPDGRSVSLRFANADVACLTQCGPGRVAVALTNHHIAIVEIGSKVAQVSDLLVDDLPSCITTTDSGLLWVSERGTMHTWTTKPQDTVHSLKSSGHQAFHARRLVGWEDGSFGLVTSRKAIRFTFASSDTPFKYPIRAVFDAPGAGQGYYAVQERPDGLWLLDGVTRLQVRLTEGSPELLQQYAMDGANHLFGIGITGQGFLMDMGSQSVRKLEDLPPNVFSVAGSPTGGFWLIDMTEMIFFLAPDGICYTSGRVELKDIGQSEIHCWPELLLWKGVCLHDNGIGEETTNATIFFQPVGSSPGALRVLGQRFFAGIGGAHQLVAFDGVRGQMWIISPNETFFEYSIMSGTPQDFIEQRERERRVSGIDQMALAARITQDGTGLYLLCMSGTLFRLDTATMGMQAILVGSIPITAMAQGNGMVEPFALVAGRMNPYLCTFHERSRQ